MVKTFKVSNGSDVRKLAGAVSHALKGDNGREKMDGVELICCGAGAVNQAIKALVISSSHAEMINRTLVVRPYFVDLDFDESTSRTGISLHASYVDTMEVK